MQQIQNINLQKDQVSIFFRIYYFQFALKSYKNNNRRHYYKDYKDLFHQLIYCLKDKSAYDFLNDSHLYLNEWYPKHEANEDEFCFYASDMFRDLNLNYSKIFEEYGDIDLYLERVLPEAITFLKLNSNISYSKLNESYTNQFESYQKTGELKELNLTYLKMYSFLFFSKWREDEVTFQKSLEKIIDAYLSIILDDMEFDSVEDVNNFMFSKDFQINNVIIPTSLPIYKKIIKCYSYLGKNNIVQKIHKQLNGSVINIKKVIYFSNTTQLRNALRLNIIDEKKFNKKENEFQQKRKINNQNNELLVKKIKETGFIELGIDKNQNINYLPEITKSLKEEVFSKLSIEQKGEYLKAFGFETNIFLIQKYFKVRLRRIFENFINHWANIPQVIEEINFLKEINNNQFSNYSDELIITLNQFSEIGKEETHLKIEILRFLDTLLGKEDSRIDMIFSINSQIFTLSSGKILKPQTFNLFKNIPRSLLREKIEEAEIKYNAKGFINRILYQQKIIEFNITENFRLKVRKSRVHVIKEAGLITELLEPFCKKFTQYVLNYKGAVFGQNFSFEYFRLARAYFTLKDFGTSVYWIDEFLMIIKKVELEYEFPEIQLIEFFDLKSKCLQKLEAEKKFQLKQKQKRKIQPIQYKSFDEARGFARNLNLKSDSEWRSYCQSGNKPNDIPGSPQHSYKDKGWFGIRDWLGNEPLNKVNYRNYDDAKKFVNSLKLESSTFWRAYCKSEDKPIDIPSNPQNTYKNKGWIDWGNWLGTGVNKFNNNPIFINFDDARLFVRNLNLKSARDYKSTEKPKNIPSHPNRVYKNKGWVDWGDWLGTEVKSRNNNDFMGFEEARIFVRKLKLKSGTEWREYRKTGNKPNNIPSNPDRVYKNKGWENWGDWLGTY